MADMTAASDDTQPRSLFQTPEPEESGPGCVVWGFMGVFGLSLAVLIVVLAGTAGWTAGQRTADENATATQSEQINQQLVRIPTDVAAGNQYLLSVRLEFLATITPGVPAVPQIQQTATALYVESLPSPSLTPTMTVEPVTTVEVTMEATPVVTTETEGGYDLDALLRDARIQIGAGEMVEAYNTLDAIIRIDPNYERATVRGLISQALITRATTLYQTPDTANLAEAIRLTDLAEEYGPIGDLNYERLIAGLYLDAERTISTGDHAVAIVTLNNIISYQSTYKGIDLRRILFDEYVRYAEAWAIGGEYCQAVPRYDAALSLFASSTVSTQRDTAQTLCEQGTPTPTLAPVSSSGG